MAVISNGMAAKAEVTTVAEEAITEVVALNPVVVLTTKAVTKVVVAVASTTDVEVVNSATLPTSPSTSKIPAVPSL